MNNESLHSMQFTHEVTRNEHYYTDGPMQGKPPDGTFKPGTKVSLSGSNIGRYTHVVSENGISGFVASDALKPFKSDGSPDLYKLNEEINDHEINRDNEAHKFFRERLHNDLHFKRADDTWISKEDFIANLKKPDPFEKRTIEGITVQQLETGHAIVYCVVVGKKQNDPNNYRYRNIRIFKQVEEKWLLHVWYNYKINTDD